MVILVRAPARYWRMRFAASMPRSWMSLCWFSQIADEDRDVVAYAGA